jgi:ectoine hydroxylase-related dioxygenase (phytanoyl-CoA dioxygenase family)
MTTSPLSLTALRPAVLREHFDRDGFVILPGYFSSERIDSALDAVKQLLSERAREIVVDNLSNGARTFWSNAAQRETRHFKFNDLYLLSEDVRALALDEELSLLLRALLGDAPVLCNSLNFQRGSQQPAHIDSLYMTPQTPGQLAATWTAFEDAHADSGPLRYWPGSHQIPLFRFRDGSRHAKAEEMPAWQAYIDTQLRERGLTEKTFLAKKGDVFIWHSDLLHGGGTIRDPARTRNSLVCHYFGETDSRRLNFNLQPRHHGFWVQRLPQPVRIPPPAFGPDNPFPENSYLARYPDVKAAVLAGGMPSGWEHYRNWGFSEGRGV